MDLDRTWLVLKAALYLFNSLTWVACWKVPAECLIMSDLNHFHRHVTAMHVMIYMILGPTILKRGNLPSINGPLPTVNVPLEQWVLPFFPTWLQARDHAEPTREIGLFRTHATRDGAEVVNIHYLILSAGQRSRRTIDIGALDEAHVDKTKRRATGAQELNIFGDSRIWIKSLSSGMWWLFGKTDTLADCRPIREAWEPVASWFSICKFLPNVILSLSLAVRRRNFNGAINWGNPQTESKEEKMRQSWDFNSYWSECAKRSDTFWIWNCQAVFYDILWIDSNQKGRGRKRTETEFTSPKYKSYSVLLAACL